VQEQSSAQAQCLHLTALCMGHMVEYAKTHGKNHMHVKQLEPHTLHLTHHHDAMPATLLQPCSNGF
jgi:hypothetical protein